MQAHPFGIVAWVPSCFSRVQLFVTIQISACQAPLSIGFSRQEYWPGWPSPPPGNLPDRGIKPTSLTSPAFASGFFTTTATGEAYESESHSVMSNTLRPNGVYSPWNSPGQNTGVGSLSLLEAIFPTQGLHSGLPPCKQVLYQLSHKGSPRILEQVAYPFSSGSSWARNQTGESIQYQSIHIYIYFPQSFNKTPF